MADIVVRPSTKLVKPFYFVALLLAALVYLLSQMYHDAPGWINVAYLVPATHRLAPGAEPSRRHALQADAWGRRDEERVARLCASGDLRPSRWRRAGDPRDMAGVATMLASESDFDRSRLLALAEALYPGMSSGDEFRRWLADGRVDPSRFLPMVRAERR